jgi:cobalamin biosynthesis protein CbiD
MADIEVDDLVYIKSTRLVGQVVIVQPEGRLEVHSQGHINNYGLADLEKLEPQDVAVINQALVSAAVAIDDNNEEESYNPVFSEEGHIVFSNAAAAALAAIDYVRLVIELRKLGEEVNDFRASAKSPKRNGW